MSVVFFSLFLFEVVLPRLFQATRVSQINPTTNLIYGTSTNTERGTKTKNGNTDPRNPSIVAPLSGPFASLLAGESLGQKEGATSWIEPRLIKARLLRSLGGEALQALKRRRTSLNFR